MRTDDLIQQLTGELAPVRRLRPGREATRWLAVAAAYVAGVVALAWVRRGTTGVEATATYVIQQGSLVATACLAVGAAFTSAIPGTPRRALRVLAPVALMVVALAWGCLHDLSTAGTFGLGRETDWPCVVSITVGGILLWSLAAYALHKGMPTEPRISALLAGTAALSVANLEACVSRSHAFTITVVAWHGITTTVLLALLALLGSNLFGQQASKRGRSAG